MPDQSDGPLADLSADEQQELVDLVRGDEPRVDRRTALQAGGALGVGALLGGGSSYAAVDRANAAAEPNGGQGDFGVPGDPAETFLDGLALVAQDISSATTLTKPVGRFDSAISGYTIELGTELEGPSSFVQPVALIDQTGNAASNPVTVEAESGADIDGESSIDIDGADTVTRFWWDGSEWLSSIFALTVDARQMNADELTINDLLNVTKATETISSGDVPYSAPYIQVEGESGSDDDLDNITGGSPGDIVILEVAEESITVRDRGGSDGNIRTAGGTNKTLDNTNDKMMLIRQDLADAWAQIAHSDAT